MANRLYQQMNGNTPNGILQQAQALKQKIGGDPMQYIQNLMNSGKVTQAQYDAAVRKAEQFRKFMGV